MPNTAISVGQSMTCMSANEAGKENFHIGQRAYLTALGRDHVY